MRILSVDGGGYLGLTTAAFIEGTELHFGKSFHSQFDLFCGTSTGAIIALALATGLSGKDIRLLYEDFGPKVFDNRIPFRKWTRALRCILLSKYSNKHLKASLEKVFGEQTLGDLHKNNKRVIITAFSLTTGVPRIFKTDHAPELSRDNGHLIRNIALASSAAPVYLPIVKFPDPKTGAIEEYCDGGVFANHPALIGFAEALYHCGAKQNDIRLLSLSTPRASLAEQECAKNLLKRHLNRGALSWFFGTKLSSIFIDANSMITHQTLRRLAVASEGTIYQRVEFRKPDKIEMDTTDPAATQTLRQIGYETASLGDTRTRIAPFFS